MTGARIPMTLAPADHADALASWLNFARLPEDPMLQAVLTNDLGAAVAAIAGTGGWAELRAAFLWMWEHAPVEAWGGEFQVAAWIRGGGIVGGKR